MSRCAARAPKVWDLGERRFVEGGATRVFHKMVLIASYMAVMDWNLVGPARILLCPTL